MLEQAITELQNIEQSVARKTLSDLQIHLALRSCLRVCPDTLGRITKFSKHEPN